MYRLENLIPPPAVLLFTLVSIFFISGFDRARSLYAKDFSLNALLATVLVVTGLVITVLAIKLFKINQTTVNPLRPDTATFLVTTGVFKLTRNPMYLSMVLFSLSSVVFFGSAWCLIAVAGFVAFMVRFQIIPEERAMEALFGKDFTEYKANTRRWI
jgi:protein-S-isoprenylcysteine O-methyltransferase Ste14